MAGYDDLPACTRYRIANALHNVTDTAVAARMHKAGTMNTVMLAQAIEAAERRVYAEGVKNGDAAPGQTDFRVRQRKLRHK